jgi:Tol biopolymer transport system component
LLYRITIRLLLLLLPLCLLLVVVAAYAGRFQNRYQLAFVSNEGPSAVVGFIDYAHAIVQPVRIDPSYDCCLRRSPDGGLLIFSGYTQAGETDLYTLDNFGQINQLTRSSAVDSDAVWSNSGGQIAFSSREGLRSTIQIVNMDGTGEQIVARVPYTVWGLAWSLDDTRLAFVADDPYQSLYTLDLTCAPECQPQLLLSSEGYKDDPVWLSERKLAYVDYDPRNALHFLNVVDVATGEVDRLVERGVSFNVPVVVWSRDRRYAAFVAPLPDSSIGEGIFLLDMTSGSLEVLHSVAGYDRLRVATFTTDGTRVLFNAESVPGYGSNIYAVPVSGGDAVALMLPAWYEKLSRWQG